MAKITVKADLNKDMEQLRYLRGELKKLPYEALNYFKDITPEDTGNAKRSTKLTPKGEIHANYPYASVLDNGYSKQAPQGMVEPLREWIDNRLKQILERK